MAGCSDGTTLRPPFLVLAPTPRDPVPPPALVVTDVVGEWRVTASYQGRSYTEDFYWPRTSSPFLLTLSEARLQLDTPCRVCGGAVSYSPAVVTLGPVTCAPTACQLDPVVAQQTDAIVFNLHEAMSMYRLDGSTGAPRMLSLTSSRGSVDIERWDR